jgi:hypothetical protein
MTKLINKLTIFLCCLVVYLIYGGGDVYSVVPVIVAVIMSAL